MITWLVQRRWLAVTSLLAVLAGLSFWTTVFWPSLHDVTNGFPVYYSSARLIYEGRWSNEIYGDTWFPAEVRAQSEGRVEEVFWPNPPSTAMLLLPVAGLSMGEARVIWLAANLIALVVAVRLIVGGLRESPAFGVGLLALTLAYGPLRQNFRIGQVYPLMLLLFVVAWRDVCRRTGPRAGRWRWAGAVPGGVALGLAGAIKWQGLPVWLVLAARYRWRMLAIGVGAGAIVISLSAALIGWPNWLDYLVMSARTPGREWMSSIAFQGTHNFFQHLLVADADFSPRPLWHRPRLASTLSLLVSGVALALTLWRGCRADASLSFAAALTLSVLVSPFALDYHYALLILPLAVMAASVLRSPRSARDAMWLVAILGLVSPPWSHYFPTLDTFASGLLGYLRLYGGWLLWLWLIVQMDTRASLRAGEAS